MKKIIIGEEEILIDENSVRQLTDDELDRACGGDGVDGVYQKGLVCYQCNFWCSLPRNFMQKRYIIEYHENTGCRGTLKSEE